MVKTTVLALTSVLIATQPLTSTSDIHITVVHESFPFSVRINRMVSPRNPLMDIIDLRGQKTSIVWPGRKSPKFKDLDHHDKLG